MRVFYSTDFEGVWPVGVAAIVVAKDEAEARTMLTKVIPKPESGFTFKELNVASHRVVVLSNGDY